MMPFKIGNFQLDDHQKSMPTVPVIAEPEDMIKKMIKKCLLF